MTVHRRFKLTYRRRLDVGLAAALLVVFALFGFSHPPASPSAPVVHDSGLEVVELRQEIVVPPPPPHIPPVIANADDVVEATLPEEDFDSTFDAREPARPPAPPPTATFAVFDQAPRPRTTVVPKYPAVARSAGIEGRVVCQVTIDENGRTVAVRILESDTEVFERPVRDALLEWTWHPARQSGNPVQAIVVVPYEFRLD